MSKPKEAHRPDIDGLRALAVLPVVFYHAKFGFPGGFVGVDVFFVISGYLICGLILKEQAEGSFSLANFWERRVRRIFPALAVVVVASLIGGWALFPSDDFEKLGQAAVAQALLLSNVFFYWQSLIGHGYFDPAFQSRPLLHTWSLAVEEQFYLFFPLILAGLARARKVPSMLVLSLLAAGSLAISILETHSATTMSAAFYLLPARAWELLVGALLALQRGKIPAGPTAREAAGILGIALIVGTILLYNDRLPFPGLAALPPCLGAVLIIFSSENGLSIAGRVLSLRPVVFIGLISYSIYLWHWPLITLLDFFSSKRQGLMFTGILLATTLALATLTWKYVETPFRKRTILRTRSRIFGFAGVCTAAILLVGCGIWQTRGLGGRPHSRLLTFIQYRIDHPHFESLSAEEVMSEKYIFLGDDRPLRSPDFMVWCDSHGLSLKPVLDDLCHQYGRRGAMAFFAAIPPVTSGGKFKGHTFQYQGKSLEAADVICGYIAQNHIRTVMLVASWSGYAAKEDFRPQLVATVRMLEQTGARVYVLKDVPTPHFETPRIVALNYLLGRVLEALGVTRAGYQNQNEILDSTFNEIAQTGAVVLDPCSYFLNSKGIYGVIKGDEVLYSDGNHVTAAGSRLLAPLLRPVIESAGGN